MISDDHQKQNSKINHYIPKPAPVPTPIYSKKRRLSDNFLPNKKAHTELPNSEVNSNSLQNNNNNDTGQSSEKSAQEVRPLTNIDTKLNEKSTLIVNSEVKANEETKMNTENHSENNNSSSDLTKSETKIVPSESNVPPPPTIERSNTPEIVVEEPKPKLNLIHDLYLRVKRISKVMKIEFTSISTSLITIALRVKNGEPVSKIVKEESYKDLLFSLLKWVKNLMNQKDLNFDQIDVLGSTHRTINKLITDLRTQKKEDEKYLGLDIDGIARATNGKDTESIRKFIQLNLKYNNKKSTADQLHEINMAVAERQFHLNSSVKDESSSDSIQLEKEHEIPPAPVFDLSEEKSKELSELQTKVSRVLQTVQSSNKDVNNFFTTNSKTSVKNPLESILEIFPSKSAVSSINIKSNERKLPLNEEHKLNLINRLQKLAKSSLIQPDTSQPKPLNNLPSTHSLQSSGKTNNSPVTVTNLSPMQSNKTKAEVREICIVSDDSPQKNKPSLSKKEAENEIEEIVITDEIKKILKSDVLKATNKNRPASNESCINLTNSTNKNEESPSSSKNKIVASSSHVHEANKDPFSNLPPIFKNTSRNILQQNKNPFSINEDILDVKAYNSNKNQRSSRNYDIQHSTPNTKRDVDFRSVYPSSSLSRQNDDIIEIPTHNSRNMPYNTRTDFVKSNLSNRRNTIPLGHSFVQSVRENKFLQVTQSPSSIRTNQGNTYPYVSSRLPPVNSDMVPSSSFNDVVCLDTSPRIGSRGRDVNTNTISIDYNHIKSFDYNHSKKN